MSIKAAVGMLESAMKVSFLSKYKKVKNKPQRTL